LILKEEKDKLLQEKSLKSSRVVFDVDPY